MKPAPFRYYAPRSVTEVLELLAEHGEQAKILAGGQSLVPAMNFRLARPDVLIDINRVGELHFMKPENGILRIGALTRHASLERPVVDGPLGHLLPLIAHHIGHLPIRVRGTFAGSLAHADPASEWCVLALTLGAEILVSSTRGERLIPAANFFRMALTTALHADEVIAEVRLPILGSQTRCGFSEFSRRVGDFALCLTVAAVRFEGEEIQEVRIGIGGAVDCPTRVPQAEEVLRNRGAEPSAIADAAEAAAATIEPTEDIHASREYRRDLVRVMTKRALSKAVS